jgi:hypothetical protein
MEYPEDQVPRKWRFEAAHPDIEITQPQTPGNNGQWHARRGGEVLCSWYDLKPLLDDLEDRVCP